MNVNDVLEEDIINCIKYREQLIKKGHDLVAITVSKKSSQNGITARELVNLASQLREHGIRCVQKIVAWTLANTEPNADSPKCFMWHGVEYLCKMHSDIDFMAELLSPKMSHHGGFARGDPFFIKKGGGENSRKRAGVAATLIVLDALERRKATFGIMYSEDDSDESTVGETNEEASRRKSSVVVHRRRRGVTNLYKTQLSDEGKDRASVLNPKLHRNETSIENIVFRGRKLYRRGQLLGSGAYAKVYACERQDGERFAVKVYNINATPTGVESEEVVYARTCFNREVDILQQLSHPHIIALEDSVLREDVPYVVLERMSCTLMEVQMDRISSGDRYKGTMSTIEKYALVVLEQLSGALAYMHSLNVMHRDIKPENVLVTMYAKGIVAKLGDFGSAVKLPGKFGELNVDLTGGSDLTYYVGSRWYRAPEMLGQGNDYGPPADIWSLGCTISEFITISPLFQGNDDQELLDSTISLLSDREIPQSLETQLQERGLEIRRGLAKRSIHQVLGCVSSALRKVVECMVCFIADERYSASGIERDVKELRVET